MTPEAKAAGQRDPVVGRRLPWAGDNYESLRSLQWQIHGYGQLAESDAPQTGLPTHVFPPAPASTGLVPGVFYLVRPDGFVAAKAAPADAAEVFRAAMPPPTKS